MRLAASSLPVLRILRSMAMAMNASIMFGLCLIKCKQNFYIDKLPYGATLLAGKKQPYRAAKYSLFLS